MEADDLKCSICLETFTIPIRITNCGHSFCGQCLYELVCERSIWSCPECRQEHGQKPDTLARNYFVETYIEKMKGKLSIFFVL